ncbi:MAG: thiol oxidoreductase [Colwellia sp.]|nr:thiol oxidoreductase [Colwellia sp.]
MINIEKTTIVYLIIASVLLTSCGGSTSSEESIPAPLPIPTEPTVDHSGLEPLFADKINILEYLSAGDATVFLANNKAFGTAPDMIDDDTKMAGFFNSGDHLFRVQHSGFGPLLNNPVCQNCHVSDGRGHLPASPDQAMLTMLIKLGDSTGAADPMYGDQLQPFSHQSFSIDLASGLAVYDASLNGDQLYGEAYPYIEYELIDGLYPDGISYQLRNPIYKIRDMSFGPFVEDIHFSPRVAPNAFGVGLLEAIPQENIIALVDENDNNNDGISGRASMVIDAISGEKKLGRFAYKAQNPSVLQQVAGAYNGDMGMTTSVFTNEPCSELQLSCQFVASQEDKVDLETDISDKELALVEFYNRVLGAPVRRGYDENTQQWDDEIVKGRQLFFEVNCNGCHTPRHVTGEAAGSILGELTLLSLEPNAKPIVMLSDQTIFPYTDLLLHDMGGSCTVTKETIDKLSCSDGQECLYVQRCQGLADGLIQGDASGSEWKTPPLWGLGLVKTVNPRATFLHDGRARTIEEAILWHSGEAATSKDAFMNLGQAERQKVLLFLQSL